MSESDIDCCDLLCLDLPHAESIRSALPSRDALERSAAAARALSDPTRLTIAAALNDGDELCVCDLAWVVSQSQNLVSHHLKQLKTAGLVSSRRYGKLVMYTLTPLGHRHVSGILQDAEPNRV